MEVQRHVGDKAHKKCKAAVILVPLSSFGCSIVPFMVWLWDLAGGHDSQQTQALEGVCLHVYTHTYRMTYTYANAHVIYHQAMSAFTLLIVFLKPDMRI